MYCGVHVGAPNLLLKLGVTELIQLITRLRLRCWMVALGRLHVNHRLLHGLQHLRLHYEHLL
jgi:hypothetical protein